MYRVRRYVDNFNESDPVTQAIALIALMLLVTIALPYLPVPWIASGAECTDMVAPRLNGNNQSILSNQADEAESLRLEVVPDPIMLTPGQPLRFDVRIINEGMAPANLFLKPGDYSFRFTGQEDGLMFSITTETGTPLGEPTSVRAIALAPQQYSPGDVRTLRPRQRCTVSVEISPERLAAAGVGQGRYFLTAVYRNRTRGALSPVEGLTPTPIFPDQGVWIGRVDSNQVTILAGVSQPAPQ